MMTNCQNHYFCLPNLDFMKIAKVELVFKKRQTALFNSQQTCERLFQRQQSPKQEIEASSEDSYFNNAFVNYMC